MHGNVCDGILEAGQYVFRLILKNQLTKKRVIAKIETIQSHILMPLCCISMWLFDIKNGRKEYHSCAHDSYSFLPFFMALNCYKFSQNRSSLHRFRHAKISCRLGRARSLGLPGARREARPFSSICFSSRSTTCTRTTLGSGTIRETKTIWRLLGLEI